MKSSNRIVNVNPLLKKSFLILFLTLFAFTPSCKKVKMTKADTLPITPLNPAHTVEKIAILTYLTNIGNSDTLISGQYIGSADPGAAFFDPAMFTGLSKKPGVLGCDFGYWTNMTEFSAEYMPTLINEGHNGSLVTLALYMPNPFNRKAGDKGDKKRYKYEDTYTPGTKANDRVNIFLNNAGNILQQLKNENITVLLRPYLEMNGDWFWWGSDKDFPTQDQYTALWKYTYNYFENDRQLDNILWVYGPNVQADDNMKPTDYYYPGANYVDIVGFSYYNDAMTDIDINQSMTKLEALNKPIAITELGSHVGGASNSKFDVDNMRYLELSKYKVSYFLIWSSWKGHYMSIQDSQNADTFMNHGLIISQDEMNY